jgi:glycosyltransferase involved in cell wall biosynthesis
MSNPVTISVVVTFWNREQYLADAIESVLAQPHDVELLLVDDGSTDASVAIARGFAPPARLIQQENQGAAGASNTGVRNATGEFVAFCDSDDLWTSARLDSQLAALALDPALDLVFGHAEEFLSPEIDPATVRTRALRGTIPATVPSAALVRKAVFDRVGPFDEALRNGAWVDWYARVRGAGARECIVPDVVMRRRIHTQNNFAVSDDAALGYLRALRPLVRKHREA